MKSLASPKRGAAIAAAAILLPLLSGGCPGDLPGSHPDGGMQPARITYDAAAVVQDAGPSDAAAPDAAVPLPLPLTPASMPAGPSFDADFAHRLRHLLDAIATSDAALCHDVQLPRKAYVEDYATKDLSKVWERGVDAAFKKQLGRLHRRHRRTELTFVALEVPKPMEPTTPRERDGWRTPVWRIEHAKLHVRPAGPIAADAKDTWIDLASLVYWRGAWYVERL